MFISQSYNGKNIAILADRYIECMKENSVDTMSEGLKSKYFDRTAAMPHLRHTRLYAKSKNYCTLIEELGSFRNRHFE